MRGHIHRYQKSTLGRNKWPIYKCSLPDCNSYISAELVEGKFSICWRCGERFVITKALGRLAKPHCMGCTERNILKKLKPEDKQFVDNLLSGLLGSEDL